MEKRVEDYEIPIRRQIAANDLVWKIAKSRFNRVNISDRHASTEVINFCKTLMRLYII